MHGVWNAGIYHYIYNLNSYHTFTNNVSCEHSSLSSLPITFKSPVELFTENQFLFGISKIETISNRTLITSTLRGHFSNNSNRISITSSQTCIKRSLLGQGKGVLLRKVGS